MKRAIYLLLALIAAVGVAFYSRHLLQNQGDPGYVLLGIGNWTMETSLLIFLAALAISFFTLYFTIWALGKLIRLPGQLAGKRANKKSSKSQEALIRGLLDSAEGNWEKAEKVLIRHAANSGVPLMHYLTAAKAAQSRGAHKKRDEYLRLAQKAEPGSELAIGLTKAELHLSHNQFEEAVKGLQELNAIAPTHGSVLKLLHGAYEHMEDWEGLRNLIPSLQKNKVMMEAELKLLENETYSGLLKEVAAEKNPEKLKELWNTIPNHIKRVSGVHAIYFAGMIENGAGQSIEPELAGGLGLEWSETLVVLYGCIKMEDANRQLQKAEPWLKDHPNDAILLRMLGRLTMRTGDFEKAGKYFMQSIEVEPSTYAYQLLGDVMSKRGDMATAAECYKKGIMVASEEIVSHSEEITDDIWKRIKSIEHLVDQEKFHDPEDSAAVVS